MIYIILIDLFLLYIIDKALIVIFIVLHYNLLYILNLYNSKFIAY